MEIGDEEKEAAIWTISHAHDENLRRFGDVVFLDGTLIRNSLRWTIYSITLINDENALIS
jgi:hypothetical protein